MRYAYLELNEKGLPKQWAEALMRALEAHLPVKTFAPAAPFKRTHLQSDE